MTRLHAFTDDVLGTRDAVGLAEAIAAGEVSAVEAVEASIARVEKVAGELGAIAHPTFDRARAEARGQRNGFFAGVPSVIKDNVDVAGVPTQQGTDAYVAKPALRNGELAHLWMKLGLVSLGKSQLSEYGFSAAAEHPRLGPVRTPWDTARIAGASSGGSAALVAAGAVPIAHGNDGGGSIRIPASVNGLVGLKPTRGRIPQDAFFALAPVRIVADGALTRSVRDTAAFLREAERYHRNHKLPPVGDITGPARMRLRVGVSTKGAGGRDADPETAELTLKTAALLEELGHQVEEVAPPVPETLPEDFVLYWSTLALAILGTGRTHGRSWNPRNLDNLTLGLAEHARANLRRVPAAITRLRATTALAEEFHATYDIALTPTVAHETPTVGYLAPTRPFEQVMERLMGWVAFTPWQNVTGAPAISLPLQTSASGLPQGMMLGAAPGREARLLELAYELEQAKPFATIWTEK